MQSVFWLIPNKLAGRAGPVLEPWDLPAIRQGGITTILSTDIECEEAIIRAEGFRHLTEFMPKAYPTTPVLVDRFVGFVRNAAVKVVGDIQAGGCVMVHCYAGRDRTGLVLGAVLMELEVIDAKAALKKVRSVRPMALSGPGVVDVLEEYAQRLFGGTF